MAEKRRLPVVQPKPDNPEDDVEPRPPWQWVGFGVVGIFGAWLPLAWIAQRVGLRLAGSKLGAVLDDLGALQLRLAELPRDERARLWAMILVPQMLALVLASLAGGYLIGRWGKGAGVREAAIAGIAIALFAGALSCSSSGAGWTALAVAAISAPCAAVGAKIGRRGRTHVQG